jgi:hypothetical protein
VRSPVSTAATPDRARVGGRHDSTSTGPRSSYRHGHRRPLAPRPPPPMPAQRGPRKVPSTGSRRGQLFYSQRPPQSLRRAAGHSCWVPSPTCAVPAFRHRAKLVTAPRCAARSRCWRHPEPGVSRRLCSALRTDALRADADLAWGRPTHLSPSAEATDREATRGSRNSRIFSTSSSCSPAGPTVTRAGRPP